ncbi:MAG: hypothetical protein RLZZ129_1890 [Verrucomicrobiota bacterium]
MLAVLFIGRRHAEKAAVASSPAGRGWLDDPWVRQGAVFGLLAFGLQLFVDFHLKIPALAMALAVVAGLLVPSVWPAKTRREETTFASRVGRFGVTAALVAVATVFVPNHYRAEALRYPARLAIDRLVDADTVAYREVLMPALASLERATKVDPRNAQAWSDLAYATGLWAHVEPEHTRQLGIEAEAYARRSLSLSRAGAEPWIRLGIALNMQGRWSEAGEAFSEALGQAPASARVWFHQAYHLSLNPITRAVARSAVALSLRLDPDYRPAQVLRQQLASAP